LVDTRISQLTDLGSSVDDATDEIPIVDSSAGQTKKIFPSDLKGNDKVVGTQDIWLPAGAWISKTTAGAAAIAQTESSSETHNLSHFDFDTSTVEYINHTLVLPRNYNNSTITFTPYWTAASGSGGVVWELKAVSLSDSDAIDTAVGTGQTSTDTLLTALDVHIAPESSAITIAGTPASQDLIILELSRKTGDASDTLGVDAKFLGAMIKISITKGTST